MPRAKFRSRKVPARPPPQPPPRKRDRRTAIATRGAARGSSAPGADRIDAMRGRRTATSAAAAGREASAASRRASCVVVVGWRNWTRRQYECRWRGFFPHRERRRNRARRAGRARTSAASHGRAHLDCCPVPFAGPTEQLRVRRREQSPGARDECGANRRCRFDDGDGAKSSAKRSETCIETLDSSNEDSGHIFPHRL